MSTLIPGMLVIVTMLITSGLLFSSFLSGTSTQAGSLRDLAQSRQALARSSINITSGAVTSPATATATDVRVLVDNVGAQSVANFSRMDVIVQYTDALDNPVRAYLAYNGAVVADNRWTNPVTGIAPDTFNPRMWDPDEVFTIDLRVAPAIKSGTSALVVVATPQAASDQTTVTN
jgi:archaellum component FlaF (FlaF/FlaG flagellin family)